MRGHLYRGHTNATALSSSPVVSALGSESNDPDSSPGRGKALFPWDVREKKMRAPLLGLAKSIYYVHLIKYLRWICTCFIDNFVNLLNNLYRCW